VVIYQIELNKFKQMVANQSL